ncbi:MAG: hypothetical protein HUJ95_04875 [Bacteroidales bacterium]|nr:hypothetical protein [Bacteroidales bacterium]
MKKIVLSIVTVLSAGFITFGQTANDALMLMEDSPNYSARVSAMAGAFTALGGDNSAININPAGGAVNKFASFAITPGAYITNTSTVGNNGFGDTNRNRDARFNLASVGINFYFDNHQSVGFKGFSFGFNVNKSRVYNEKYYASGLQQKSSIAGYYAACANGIATGYLRNEASDLYNNGNVYWPTILSWKGALIDPVYEGDENADYIGVTEDFYPGTSTIKPNPSGELNQTYERYRSGDKLDMAINIATNINDMFYIGATLGITDVRYNYDDSFKEIAKNRSEFPTLVDNLNLDYLYSTRVTGVYGKFGIIIVPVKALRLGAAIQTPSILNIVDSWQWKSGVKRQIDGKDEYITSSTPEAGYKYSLSTPLKVNAGASLVLGNFAIISADYEFINYSRAQYRERKSANQTNFKDVNNDISKYLGVAHTLRLGAEIRPIQQFAIRAGYAFQTCPEYLYNEETKKKTRIEKAFSHEACAGLGFDTGKMFYFDLAFTVKWHRDTYYTPYGSYVEGIAPPEIRLRKDAYNCLATIGLRF